MVGAYHPTERLATLNGEGYKTMKDDPLVTLAHLESILRDTLDDAVKLLTTLTELMEVLKELDGDDFPSVRSLETASASETATSILLWAESRVRSYCEMTGRPKPIILGKLRKIKGELADRIEAVTFDGELPF